MGGLNVSDSALREVNVEPQEMVVFNCLKVAKKVVVNESLDGWVREEMVVVDNEAVVDVAVVVEVEIGVVKELVVELVPGVFNESMSAMAMLHRAGDRAGSQSERHEFAGRCGCKPGNTSVERKSHDGGDVSSVEGALCGTSKMVVVRVAGGLGVNGDGVSGLLLLPLLDQAVDGVDQAMLLD